MTAQARLRVDPIACDGRGLCAEVAPELVILDDWGFPIVAGDTVPPRWVVHAREAVRLCPKLALRLEQARSDGSRSLMARPPESHGHDGDRD
jgi:ferredoxin